MKNSVVWVFFFFPPFNLNSIQISYFIVYSLFRRSTEFVLVSFFVIFSKRSVYWNTELRRSWWLEMKLSIFPDISGFQAPPIGMRGWGWPRPLECGYSRQSTEREEEERAFNEVPLAGTVGQNRLGVHCVLKEIQVLGIPIFFLVSSDVDLWEAENLRFDWMFGFL